MVQVSIGIISVSMRHDISAYPYSTLYIHDVMLSQSHPTLPLFKAKQHILSTSNIIPSILLDEDYSQAGLGPSSFNLKCPTLACDSVTGSRLPRLGVSSYFIINAANGIVKWSISLQHNPQHWHR